MSDAPLFPPELLARLSEFLAQHRTGRVIFNVHQGAVKSAVFEDTWRRNGEPKDLTNGAEA